MRTFLFLALASAAFAADNSIQTSGNWYASASAWSLGRFPRHTDVVSVIDQSSIRVGDGVTKPATYQGATEGEVLVIADASEVVVAPDGLITLGEQATAPQDCQIGTFGDWGANGVAGECTKTCDTGSQSRSRTNVQPTFGGDACPDDSTNTETQACNVQACGCPNGKNHGDIYAAPGKDYCNLCKCHNGAENCDDRACTVHTQATICDKTTCQYGALFHDSDEFMTFAEADVQYPGGWANLDYELSTRVQHDSGDANGSNFHCGHVRDTTDTCKCYCSDQGSHQIWHHHQRFQDDIDAGKTSAGCDCEANWTGPTGRGPFTGCQNPAVAGEPAGYGGDRHSTWCKIVPGSCSTDRAVAAGTDWDVCEDHATFKLQPSN